jgi:hypothetical protein
MWWGRSAPNGRRRPPAKRARCPPPAPSRWARISLDRDPRSVGSLRPTHPDPGEATTREAPPAPGAPGMSGPVPAASAARAAPAAAGRWTRTLEAPDRIGGRGRPEPEQPVRYFDRGPPEAGGQRGRPASAPRVSQVRGPRPARSPEAQEPDRSFLLAQPAAIARRPAAVAAGRDQPCPVGRRGRDPEPAALSKPRPAGAEPSSPAGTGRSGESCQPRLGPGPAPRPPAEWPPSPQAPGDAARADAAPPPEIPRAPV